MRLLIAVVASISAVIPIALIQVALLGDWNDPLIAPYLYGALWISAIFVIAAGLPIHFTLKHLKRQRGLYYVIAGSLIAILFVIVGRPFGNDGYPVIAIQALQFGIYAAIAALVFWRIAVPRSTRVE